MPGKGARFQVVRNTMTVPAYAFMAFCRVVAADQAACGWACAARQVHGSSSSMRLAG
jgi:hypothetical protein